MLLLEAAERSPALENNLPITTGTTATWNEELLPDAFPLLKPGTSLRKNLPAVGKLCPKHPSYKHHAFGAAKRESGSALSLGAAEERGWEVSALL